MPLAPGTRLGHYEILSPLGAGGMGQVYRARDPRLGRDVALKILPPEFASNADRRRRFEQEARAVAALNHPNIVALYDVGENYFVTELVDGSSLRGASFNVRKSVDIAAQIADGLAAAHSTAITHRDLKPDNVMVTRDGRAKILDFGLAKWGPAPGTDAATLTEPGAIMGTAGYMSPEQVKGEAADSRTDIFSLGVMLYEMLAGHRAFTGETAVEMMTAIVKSDPPELPEPVPARVREMVTRCLEKDPPNRFQSAKDLAFALRAISQPPGKTVAPHDAVHKWPVAALLVLALLLGVAGGRRFWPREEAPSWTGTLLAVSGVAFGHRISPDGQLLAFQILVDGQSQLAVMKPNSGDWTVLTRGRGTLANLCWSADGSKIYLTRCIAERCSLVSIPALGGDERPVMEDVRGLDALSDGSLLVSRLNRDRQQQLYRFWPETGRLDPLPALLKHDLGVDIAPVRVFPGGGEAVFFGQPVDAPPDTPGQLYAIDLASGKTRQIARGLSIPVASQFFALATHRDGQSVVINLPSGDLHRLVALPRYGSGPPRTLVTLTMAPGWVDMSSDGSLYVDQWDRPLEVLRFPAPGSSPQRLAGTPGFHLGWSSWILPLPDGRVLYPMWTEGRRRLMLARPNREPVPLFDTQEETATPAVMLGPDELVLSAGAGSARHLAAASISQGRITRRLAETKGLAITSLAASRDGAKLYYVAQGAVWEMRAAGGPPRKLRSGDKVAVDPRTQDLIVQMTENQGTRLMRVPASGGPEREIPVRGANLTQNALGLGPVNRNGKILVQVEDFSGSWFWKVAILDPESGRVEIVSASLEGDAGLASWAPDGSIVAIGVPVRSRIWRFRPEAR